MSNVIDMLSERGLLDAMTSEDMRTITKGPIRVYCGFDPTADSLHLGNLIAILGLAWFQRCGHTPVALIGGATGMIGDPSGRSHERPLLDEETLAINQAGIQKCLEAVLDFNHPTAKPIIVNNYDWFKGFNYIEFLRDVGKHFRVGSMMGKESVKARLNSDEGISYTEFSYQVLQSYDFVHLFDDLGVTIQLGGADQWGNITAGTELLRKMRGETAYGLTFPLLTRSDGKKFGKTAEGAVWLREDRLSAYDFYQYLIRTNDIDVIRFLKVMTFLPIAEIEALEASMQEAGYAPNTVQKRLAEEVTRIVHGESGLENAQRITAQAAPGKTATDLDRETLETLARDLPSLELALDSFLGKDVLSILVETGMCASKGEARRLVRNGGCYLNNQKIDDEKLEMTRDHLVDAELILLGVGKKKKMVLRIS